VTRCEFMHAVLLESTGPYFCQ